MVFDSLDCNIVPGWLKFELLVSTWATDMGWRRLLPQVASHGKMGKIQDLGLKCHSGKKEVELDSNTSTIARSTLAWCNVVYEGGSIHIRAWPRMLPIQKK